MRRMRYRVLKLMLLLGAFFGFAGGFASMALRMHRHHDMRRSYFERHVADVCLDAADRRRAESTPDYRPPRADAWGYGPWQAPYWAAPPPPGPPPPPARP